MLEIIQIIKIYVSNIDEKQNTRKNGTDDMEFN